MPVLQECTFHPALVSDRLIGQGRALRQAETLAHYPAPPSDYPDSPDSHKYQVYYVLCLAHSICHGSDAQLHIQDRNAQLHSRLMFVGHPFTSMDGGPASEANQHS